MSSPVDTASVLVQFVIVRNSQSGVSVDRMVFFFFQAEDGIRDLIVTGVQTCALPISAGGSRSGPLARRLLRLRPLFRPRHYSHPGAGRGRRLSSLRAGIAALAMRSEEHTSELQSRSDLVCRLLLEKKKTQLESEINNS